MLWVLRTFAYGPSGNLWGFLLPSDLHQLRCTCHVLRRIVARPVAVDAICAQRDVVSHLRVSWAYVRSLKVCVETTTLGPLLGLLAHSLPELTNLHAYRNFAAQPIVLPQTTVGYRPMFQSLRYFKVTLFSWQECLCVIACYCSMPALLTLDCDGSGVHGSNLLDILDWARDITAAVPGLCSLSLNLSHARMCHPLNLLSELRLPDTLRHLSLVLDHSLSAERSAWHVSCASYMLESLSLSLVSVPCCGDIPWVLYARFPRLQKLSLNMRNLPSEVVCALVLSLPASIKSLHLTLAHTTLAQTLVCALLSQPRSTRLQLTIDAPFDDCHIQEAAGVISRGFAGCTLIALCLCLWAPGGADCPPLVLTLSELATVRLHVPVGAQAILRNLGGTTGGGAAVSNCLPCPYTHMPTVRSRLRTLANADG